MKSYKRKIMLRPAWELLHTLNHLKKFPKMNLEKQCLSCVLVPECETKAKRGPMLLRTWYKKLLNKHLDCIPDELNGEGYSLLLFGELAIMVPGDVQTVVAAKPPNFECACHSFPVAIRVPQQ